MTSLSHDLVYQVSRLKKGDLIHVTHMNKEFWFLILKRRKTQIYSVLIHDLTAKTEVGSTTMICDNITFWNSFEIIPAGVTHKSKGV